MMLIYENADQFAARSSEQQEALFAPWRAYYRALLAEGVYAGGSPLQPPATGATVRLAGGKRQVQDGPYADTKEQLGGVIVLDVPSFEAALEWAARCPTALNGAVEVRPVSDEVRHLVEDD
jgi:hypothetical protein